MRVLHVLPSIARAYGGPTRSLAAYCQASRDAGIETVIAAPRPGEDDIARFQAESGAVELHLFASRGSGAFVTSRPLRAWASSQLAGFDVMHVHGLLNPVSSLSARLAIRRQVPVVIRPFGMLSRYTYTHRRRLIKRVFHNWLDRPNLTRADAIHFTTEREVEEARWQGLDLADRAFVIPPPVTELESGARSHDPGRLSVVCIARMDRVKRIELLLDAWPIISRDFPAAHLTVAGDGERGYVRDLRDRPAIASRADVDFCGFVGAAAKRELLGRADVFVLPSRHENFGVSIIEAVAAGVAVVTTPEVGVASFIQREKLGRIVAAEPEAIAAAVTGLLGNAEERANIARRGPTAVRDEFSVAGVGKALRSMYESILERRTQRF